MKKLLFVLAVVSCLSLSASGQEKGAPAKERASAAYTPPPDWQSMYQHESAKDYIRRRAQEKTAARQARIEGMKWLGHSPARPVVSTTPFMSRVPMWVSYAPTGYWGPGVWTGRPIYSPAWLP